MTHLIHGFKNQHKEWLDLLEGLDQDSMHKRHKINKWSIHEQVAHLGRYQEIFADRLRQILTVDKPAFTRYVAEEDECFDEWRRKPSAEICSDCLSRREDLIHFITNLSPAQLQRSGTHPKLGELDISQWLHFFLLHESHHIYTIFGLIHEFGLKKS